MGFIMNFAYADPPYYQQGKRLYGDLHKDAAIWDDKDTHIELIESLKDNYPDGWAMSCNPANLWWLLADQPDLRICVWTKTFHQIRPTTVQYAFEPVLLFNGRKENKRKPMVRDWLSCRIAMKKGLTGAKPLEFNLWILDLLNFKEGDTLDDIFVGSGSMTEALEVWHKSHKTESQIVR